MDPIGFFIKEQDLCNFCPVCPSLGSNHCGASILYAFEAIPLAFSFDCYFWEDACNTSFRRGRQQIRPLAFSKFFSQFASFRPEFILAHFQVDRKYPSKRNPKRSLIKKSRCLGQCARCLGVGRGKEAIQGSSWLKPETTQNASEQGFLKIENTSGIGPVSRDFA